MSEVQTRIVIIGAGIAGLAAAKTLEDENFHDYLLLEAQDYIGGRIRSIAWNNNWIEEGGQFLHGDNSEFGRFCHENQLLSENQSQEGEGVYIRNDGMRVDKNIVREIDNFIRDTLEDCEKFVDINDKSKIPESVGSLLEMAISNIHEFTTESREIQKMKEEIFDWNVKFLLIDNSCSSLNDLSAKNWGKFQFAGGPEHLIFKDGYSSATKLIAQSLNSHNIQLNTPVQRIEWREITVESTEKSIVITLNDKRKISTDCVIVTCSLGYLKENHRKLFTPFLPVDHCRAIECLGFGLINKIFLDFGEPWWEPDVEGFQLVWQRNNDCNRQECFNEKKLANWTKDLTGFDVLEDHDAVLLGWVGGKGAHVIESMSDDEVALDCIDLLRWFLKNDNLPTPKRCRRTQWNKNEYIRGSYSHISVACDKNGVSPMTLADPVWSMSAKNGEVKRVPVIMLAGEATHDQYYSTTHGAYDSGVRQAMNFLRYHVY